jgi:hypothetical protein
MISVPFLKEAANYLLEQGEVDLSSVCIVFPNKRARLYLSKYLGELTEKPVWAPRYFTISELMESISGYCMADRLTLLFELYTTYMEITGSQESFDLFYPYSESLLADFDEMDKYLVNADDLFQNLSGLKLLDGRFNYLSEEQVALINRFWSTFKQDSISTGQESFISLWQLLHKVYHKFRDRLHQMNLAYEGMAYRKALEHIGTESTAIDSYSKLWFIGFNALSTCEEQLFRYLKNQNKAEFFWDYDQWYVNNDIHEAGYFMRKNIRNFPERRYMNHDHLSKKKQQVMFIPVSSNSGQAAILPHIFGELGIRNKEEIENTALVLADEGLLMSALYSVPEYVTDINVTMGYPLAGSSVYSLIDSLYELIRNARKDSTGKSLWYFHDVIAVMGNPMLRAYYRNTVEQVRKKAINEHMVYFLKDQITGEGAEDIIFNDHLHEGNCDFLLNVVATVIRENRKENKDYEHADQVQLELLFQVYTYLTRLKDILISRNISTEPGTLFRLLRKMLKGMHIPFSGEPLAGLQVLGILETRILDFNHVIMLSVNEGVMPKASEKPSFVPYNLRSGFGMPTSEHYDAIYAYYFYRLIQRAESIVFTYDSSSGGLRTGERSRFMHQLFYEMRLPVQELVVSASIAQIPVKAIVIEKTKVVADQLSVYYSEGSRVLSPSAINEFLNCPLRFYLHHIAHLPQPDEIEDEVDARAFGNILHSAMRLIYEPFEKRVISREMLMDMLKNDELINRALDQAFNESLFGDKQGTSGRKPEGYNLIVRQVIYTYIRQFIALEASAAPFSIQGLEEKCHSVIPVVVGGTTQEVKIGGIIDRIDIREGRICILDYKTGSVKDRFPSVGSLFSAEENLRNDAVFQVFLYSYVYLRLHPGTIVRPGLFFIRQTHLDDFTSLVSMGPKKEIVEDFSVIQDEFEQYLKTNLENLFDIRQPFTQTGNMEVCSFCPYTRICRREHKD